GLDFSPEATYQNLKRWLAEGDEAKIREVLEGRDAAEAGTPACPTRLPMGRVDLLLPLDWSLASGGLHLSTGEADLELAGYREHARLRASILRDTPVLCLRITGLDGEGVKIQSLPPDAPDVVERFRRYGMPRAEVFDLDEFGGWVQECPGEPALCVAWLRHVSPGGLVLFITSVYGPSPVEARREALRTLEAARAEGYTPATLRGFSGWRKWWAQSPTLELPDPTLSLLYHLGMYKLGGLSVPGSPAATLQGPWVEEHRLPPWSGDYHFNVNLQECYWPCFAGNHLECLEPLAAMLRSWEPRLRENARVFAGVHDGLQLPHATDDRGPAIRGFWTGFVDHGSTGWTAQLLWQRYRFTLDRDFLRDAAYPFLRGAMRVYEAMLEDDGRVYSLPVGVSPEFGAAGLRAWGRNASFQLAVIHFLCDALCRASVELGVDDAARERWSDIAARLPLAAVGEGPELLLWEGQPLTESHRHHSHLAAIYPFDLLDHRQSGPERALVQNSMRRLTRMGMGQWTGWSLPWAAILHARLGNGEMSALLLETFRRTFMTAGHASTHDARFPGFSNMDSHPEVMQVEAATAAAAAVMEMLLHTSGGVLRIFPAIPRTWTEAAFRGIRAEGAFLVDAELKGGLVAAVRFHSEAGATLRLQNPWVEAPVAIRRDGGAPEHARGRLLELRTSPGETLELLRV
ncbi:MAG: glycosyl hydrolase family 95 catalytic domain-containing protein, partial [Actinomycetota bacterium]